MNPFYFGSRERRLFGLYTPAVGGGARIRAAVLCHPWGQEYMRAHRTMKQLASSLNAQGIHVLRFDYFGTGDSAGDMTDADIPGWEGDIVTAIEELRDTTDAPKVSLIGMRLGATLAARVAAARAADVDAVVLWDPVVSGGAYLQELLERSGPVPPRSAEAGGGHEVLGFALTETLATGIGALDLLAQVPALPRRTLCVVSEALPLHASLADALAARTGAAPPIESIPAELPWLKPKDGGDGIVPVAVLRRVADWMR